MFRLQFFSRVKFDTALLCLKVNRQNTADYLFYFICFIALPLYSFKRKRSRVFNIVRMLSLFQLGDVRSSCRPKWKELISENLLCCNKGRVLLVSCWWPSNVFSSTPRHCSSSRSLPPSLPTQAQDLMVWRQRFHCNTQGLCWVWRKGSCLLLSSSQQLPFSPDWCSLLAYYL